MIEVHLQLAREEFVLGFCFRLLFFLYMVDGRGVWVFDFDFDLI